VENLALLREGKLDIALVQGEALQEVFSGYGGGAPGLGIIIAMYSSPGMFAVRKDSPYRSIRDLVGKPVAFGAAGSGLVIMARSVLDGMGLDQDRDFEALYLEHAADGPAMVLDNRAAALWGGGINWPGFEAIATSPSGARFLVPGPGEIDRILARHPALWRLTVPANSYPGQDRPLDTVGSWSFVLARPGLPDSVAYRIVRALRQNEALLAARLVQARETTLANTLAAVPRRDLLHPGVRRYLREIGMDQ